MPKIRKFPILMKHVCHATQIPSSNQSPPCHSAYQDMGLRTVLQSGCLEENAYSTPIITLSSFFVCLPSSCKNVNNCNSVSLCCVRQDVASVIRVCLRVFNE
ncbi:hypothetical protein TNCV_83821 [Trichonephila clavipes]|nr:hypothetical protein TNCV_83821 [Trichonephila clavipes]